MKTLLRFAFPMILLVLFAVGAALAAPTANVSAFRPTETHGAETLTAEQALTTPTLAPANSTPEATSSGQAAPPYGLSAVNNFEATTRVGSPFDDRTYTNPNIAGITFRTTWADVEPADGTFDWDKLDTAFQESEANGKWVELVIIAGFGAPQWALVGVKIDSFSVLYGPGQGDERTLPLPWDQTYLSRWFAFLQAVSDRYENRPSFTKIAADGPTSLSGEMTLPDTPADICNWIKDGYTSTQFIATWEQVFAQFSSIFPRQYFSLAHYAPLPIVSSSRCDNGKPTGLDQNESTRVLNTLVTYAVNNYPKQFVLQANGLRAVDTALSTTDKFISSYSGKIVIGWQLATSAMKGPMYMAGVSDGVTALQKVLQKGVDGHAQFLEIYEEDVLPPATQSVLATIAKELPPPTN